MKIYSQLKISSIDIV